MRIATLFLILFGFLGVIPFFASASEPSKTLDPAKVVGEWVLCSDPDGGGMELVQFMPEGYGFILNSNNEKIPFLYIVTETQVNTITNYQSTLMQISFEHDKEFAKLTLKSAKTGSVSFFVRSADTSTHSCTVK